jgi:uncharacterized protein YegL
MPRMSNVDPTMDTGKTATQAFKFSGTRIEHLANVASEFTLVTVAVDVTGSTDGFAKELRDCLIAAVESCKKSPRKANLLLRVILFSTSLSGGIEEIHGFKPLIEVDPTQYPNFSPSGMTPLNDATFSAVGATNAYAKNLMAQDFTTNGIVFIVTDGGDNDSKTTATMIKNELARARQAEEIESLVTILIGINAKYAESTLLDFQRRAGLDQYIDAGDATPGKLAKLAVFVSQSVSSQSQAIGSGGPSQNIAATI